MAYCPDPDRCPTPRDVRLLFIILAWIVIIAFHIPAGIRWLVGVLT
jgi:hypothetical protein